MVLSRYQQGIKTLDKIDPRSKKRISKLFKDIAPDMAECIIEFPYGTIYSRPGLNLQTRELVTIASLVTSGKFSLQLKVHLNNALNVGCKPKEIVEVIMQMSVYSGFPSALMGLLAAEEVFKTRKIKIKKVKKRKHGN